MNTSTLSILIAAIILLPSVTACSDDDTFDASDTGDNRLVVEGIISSGGYTDVLLTSSITPDTEGGEISEAVIKWGYVSVSDGTTTVILTGTPDKKYMPPYRYFNHSMAGEPGRTYSLEATYEGKHVTARSTMPEPTPIESLEIAPVEGNDTLRAVTMRFIAPDDCPAYYHLSTRANGIDSRHYPATLGCVAATEPGRIISVPVYRGKHFSDTTDFTPNWPVGCTASVRLERVEKEVYDFWEEYNNLVLFGGSQFVGTPTSLPGNIEGGYGVWSAAGVSSATIEIR